MELHSAAASTVTVIPLLTTTSSEDVGTDEPPHVVVELQLPVTDAVLVAANAVEKILNKISVKTITAVVACFNVFAGVFIIIKCLWFIVSVLLYLYSEFIF
jgi:hypothetical protein